VHTVYARSTCRGGGGDGKSILGGGEVAGGGGGPGLKLVIRPHQSVVSINIKCR
jgi:hypothetical protein